MILNLMLPLKLKRKTIRKSLIVVAATAILFLLILIGIEVYLRLTETHIVKEEGGGLLSVELDAEFLVEYTSRGRRLIPNARVLIKNHRISHRDIEMKINSLGFRGDEIPSEKGSDELRILILGDSITWASYLQEEETFVERAEEYLRQSLPGRSVEVINAGVGDVGLKEEIAILEERGLPSRPDLVVISFYLNDSRPPWGFPGELGGRGWLRRNSLLAETIYKNLKLRNFIKEEGEDRLAWTSAMNKMNWAGDRDTFLKLASLARYDWGAAWDDNSWKVIDRELDRLKELSLKHGFKVAIVSFPVAFQVYADFLENTPQEIILKKAGSRSFYYLDLLPYLREYIRDHKDIYYDWCHPAVDTNDFIGKIIADFLFREIQETAD
jgi:lysophospholipase L1-like esterase